MPPSHAAVVPKHICLAADDEAPFLPYARLELEWRATRLCNEAEMNLKLARKKYKRHHERHFWFASTITEGEGIYLEGPSLFRSAAEKPTVKGHNKLLLKKWYRNMGVNDNTLRILQDGVDNTFSVHRATMAPTQDATATNPTEKNNAHQKRKRAPKQPRKTH